MKKKTKPKSKSGFASMDESLQRTIASLGGRAVSANREHMAMIGKQGGIKSGITRKTKSLKP